MSLFKVLVVSSKYQPEYSGSGLRTHKTYLRMKARFGLEFEAVCGSVTFSGSEDYELDGIRVKRVSRKLFHKSFEYQKSYSLLEKVQSGMNFIADFLPAFFVMMRKGREAQVIHVIGQNAVTAAACVYARIFKKPLVVELVNLTAVHPLPHIPQPFRAIFGRRVDPRTSFVCISPKLAELLYSFGYWNHVWTRPNPYDDSRYFPKPENRVELRKRHTKFSATDRLIVNIGSLQPIKNQAFLVSMLGHLPEEYKLYLAGPTSTEGPNRERDEKHLESIRAAITEFGLEGRVELKVGFVEDTAPILQAADVYALPSLTEGFGTPMIESIASGVPVVANRLPGVTDVFIAEGENGYVCELDPQKFANKIRDAVQIPVAALLASAKKLNAEYSATSLDAKQMNLLQETITRYES